jgi:hypothetical protein
VETITWKLELELDPGSAYINTLLHFDGADASTTFIDDSGKIWTAQGSAQIDTAESVFGESGLFNPATGDYISTPDHSNFHFGSGDFTIDFRVKFSVLPESALIYLHTDSLVNLIGFAIEHTDDSYVWHLTSWSTGVMYVDISCPMDSCEVDTWYHIALTRSGNNTRMFVDGQQIGTTDTTSYTLANVTVTGSAFIGANLNGWIDEFRISKGFAQWTANFTPPTEAYAGWTDCTEDVSLMDGPIEFTDGIRSTSMVDLIANPGSISWVFDNSAANSAGRAGYYSPGHTNCRDGFKKNIRVRFSEYYNNTLFVQCFYWLKKPIPSAGVFGAAITRCQAMDWLDLMMNIPLPPIGVQTNQTGDQLLTTLLAAVTLQPEDIDFDTGDSTFVSAFDTDDVSKDSVYSVLAKIARSEYGRIYVLN